MGWVSSTTIWNTSGARPSAVGMKPEKKEVSLSGTQGWAKLAWATEWFFGRKRNSTMSPRLATTLLGSKLRPFRPAVTECVTPVREAVLLVMLGVVVVGGGLGAQGLATAAPARARATAVLNRDIMRS